MSEVILTYNKIHGRIPEWPKGTDCKSAANCFDGSNPSPSICRSGGTGRRPGLKIPWVVIPVPVRSRFAARLRALIHTNRSSFSISIFQPPVPGGSSRPSFRPHYQPRRRPPGLACCAGQHWKSGLEKPEKMEAFRETEIWCSTPDFKAF